MSDTAAWLDALPDPPENIFDRWDAEPIPADDIEVPTDADEGRDRG